MAIPALIPVISLISTVFSGWMGAKKVKAEGKAKIATAKVEAKVQQIKNKADMDAQAAGDMRYTWKDEYLTLLISIPVVMSFIPGLAPYVAEGFKVLSTTPEWYRYSFLGIIAATFGLRTWFNKMK